MITKQEILERAAEWRLRADVVEKDYVLGWILAGIGNHAELSESWIFKGGTCLKKCYFETYRFSEDLDFSLIPGAIYTSDGLLRQIKEVARWVQEHGGIDVPEASIVIDSKKNKQGQPTFRARVSYRGPLAMPTPPRVLLDLTQHEVIAAEPDERSIFHPYPDEFPEGTSVSAYCLEELFAEKTRALHERTRPRDLYDVVQLVDNYSDAVDFSSARAFFRTKCSTKGIAVPVDSGASPPSPSRRSPTRPCVRRGVRQVLRGTAKRSSGTLAERVRSWPVRSYRIFYRREGENLTVLRIHHSARRPISR